MFNEIKTGFGRYLARFHEQLVPTTRALEEYCRRDVVRAIAWTPARVLDSAEDMLAQWRSNDNSGAPGTSASLPVILVALSREPTLSPEWQQQIGDPVDVILPNDPKQRVFKLRQAQMDLRAQVVIFASDDPSARSLSVQYALWVASLQNRRFDCPYTFTGVPFDYPCMIETPDMLFQSVPSDQKNLAILVSDLTLRVTVPLLKAPGFAQANDGQGVPSDGHTPDDLPGFRVLRMITHSEAGRPVYVSLVEQEDGSVIETRSPEPIP